MTLFTHGYSVLIALAASRPPMPGMPMSIVRGSGITSSIRASASSPEATTPGFRTIRFRTIR